MSTKPNARTEFSSWDGDRDNGMTKREEFAKTILSSLVRRSQMQLDNQDMDRLAKVAVHGADALIKELNEKK
jgi:hypothetical protein